MMIEIAEMNDFLMRYIDTYDVFTGSINASCYFLFGVMVFLEKENILGITSNDSGRKLAHPCLFIACSAFCLAAFVSNFYIHTKIAGFFSAMYQQESKIEGCGLQSSLEYFHSCVRGGNFDNLGIATLAEISFMFLFCAFLSVLAWFWLELKNRRTTQSK